MWRIIEARKDKPCTNPWKLELGQIETIMVQLCDSAYIYETSRIAVFFIPATQMQSTPTCFYRAIFGCRKCTRATVAGSQTTLIVAAVIDNERCAKKVQVQQNRTRFYTCDTYAMNSTSFFSILECYTIIFQHCSPCFTTIHRIVCQNYLTKVPHDLSICCLQSMDGPII